MPLVTSPVMALSVTLLIRADELCAGQHMAFHSLLDCGFDRFSQIERGIELQLAWQKGGGEMHILLSLAILVPLAACSIRQTATTDRTVTPLPSQVVTPVNPPPPSQPVSLKPPIHPSSQ